MAGKQTVQKLYRLWVYDKSIFCPLSEEKKKKLRSKFESNSVVHSLYTFIPAIQLTDSLKSSLIICGMSF